MLVPWCLGDGRCGGAGTARRTPCAPTCLAAFSVSMPGSAAAILRNRALMLNPALALVSMNITASSRALASPSSIDTCAGVGKGWDSWGVWGPQPISVPT